MHKIIRPRLVLGVTGKYPFYKLRHSYADGALVRLVASSVKMPESTAVIVLEKRYKPLRQVFAKIERAEIYRA